MRGQGELRQPDAAVKGRRTPPFLERGLTMLSTVKRSCGVVHVASESWGGDGGAEGDRVWRPSGIRARRQRPRASKAPLSKAGGSRGPRRLYSTTTPARAAAAALDTKTPARVQCMVVGRRRGGEARGAWAAPAAHSRSPSGEAWRVRPAVPRCRCLPGPCKGARGGGGGGGRRMYTKPAAAAGAPTQVPRDYPAGAAV